MGRGGADRNVRAPLVHGLPFGLGSLEAGMRNEQVPDDGLKGLSMWGDRFGVHGWDDDAGIGHGRGEAAVSPDNAEYARADLFRVFERADQVGADLLGQIPSAYGEHEDHVPGLELAHSPPVYEHAGPAIVVGSGREFRDVVGGRIGLDAGDLPEIIDGM